MLFLVLMMFLIAILFLYLKSDGFTVALFIISPFIFAILVLIPIKRHDSSLFASEIKITQKTLDDFRQNGNFSDVERTAVLTKVIDLNIVLDKMKKKRNSYWTNIYVSSDIDEVNFIK